MDISYESPDKVNVKGDEIELKDDLLVLHSNSYWCCTYAVSAATTGTYGGAVASFELRGIADPTYGISVCVDNLFPFVP